MDVANPESMKAKDFSSKPESLSEQKVWKGYDAEDVNLLFSIVYRAIFKENVFSSPNVKKEILIDGENKLFHLQKVNKVIKMITEDVLKRIVKLQYFESIVKIIFEEKYPNITTMKLDQEEIIDNILKNFKTAGEGDIEKIENEEGEQKHTDEEKDMVEYENNLKELHQNLNDIRNKIKMFEKQVLDLPQKIMGKLANKASQPEEKSNLSVKNLTEAKLKMEEEKKDFGDASTRVNSRVTKSSEESSNTKNGNGSNKLSKDSSMSVSQSNGNGSHGSNERYDFEERDNRADEGAEGKEDEEDGLGGQPEKSKLPKKATDILKTWFLNNIDHPYPTVETKEMLCKATGLNKKQIQNWFTNSRKRFLEPLKRKLDSESKSKTGNVASQLGQPENASEMAFSASTSQPLVTQKPSQYDLSERSVSQHPQQPTHQTLIQSSHQPIPQPQQQQVQVNATPQPVIIPTTTEPVPHNTYYYPPNQTLVPQNTVNPIYPSNYIRAPNGQILVPASYIQQPQAYPVYLNPPPQGAYIVVNRPPQNYMPVGMIPTNGAYIVPVQNYSYMDPNALNNQNMMDVRGLYAHNLSTNFNTIHNNVYNNINPEQYAPQPMGYPQPVFIATPTKPQGMPVEENKTLQRPIQESSTQMQVESNINKMDLETNLNANRPNQLQDQGQHNFSQMLSSKKQEFRLEDPGSRETERMRDMAGKQDFMELPLEKKVHKEDNGNAKNAFRP